MSNYAHIPVLLDHVLAALDPQPGQSFLDCTAGLGGHAAAIAARTCASNTPAPVILCDMDAGNLKSAAAHIAASAPTAGVHALHTNFAAAPHLLTARALTADLVLADLGFASPQVDDAARGLSFMRDGPLDMRLDQTNPQTAATLIAEASEYELRDLIRDFGEERHAGLVARKIVAARQEAPITTTTQLAKLIRDALRTASGTSEIDPATRTFQAIRIAVNDELGNLQALLDAITTAAWAINKGKPTWLSPGAKIAMIAFHSLEDRPIKHAFDKLVTAGLGTHITKKPLMASDDEAYRNPRSRSAKLRVVRVG